MAVNWGSMEEFLSQCKQSGDSAYGALRSLLQRLEDPKTRTEARIFLSDLQKRFDSKEDSDQCLQTFHFHIQDIHIEHYEGSLSIRFSIPLDHSCAFTCAHA